MSTLYVGDSKIDDSDKVNKSGDTMTGTLYNDTVNAVNGNGLICYHPNNWTGVNDTQWGTGSLDSQGIIRSNNSSLIHFRAGIGNATIWDSGNDGSGSGLDADLLDGLHSYYFPRLFNLGANTDVKPFYVVLCKAYYNTKVNRTAALGHVQIFRGSAVADVVSIIVKVSAMSAYNKNVFTHDVFQNESYLGCTITKRRIKYNEDYYLALHMTAIGGSGIRFIGFIEGITPFVIPDTSVVTEYSDIS